MSADDQQLVVALKDFLGAGFPVPEEQATSAVQQATQFAEAYTRGNCRKRNGQWRDGVPEVIVSAAARMVGNPLGISYQDNAGPFSTRRSAGFIGFSLAEMHVLNRYRKRAR